MVRLIACMLTLCGTTYYAWFNLQPSSEPVDDRFGLIIKTSVEKPSMCVVEHDGNYSVYGLEKNGDSDKSYRVSRLISGKPVSLKTKKVFVSVSSDTQGINVEHVH